MQKGYDVFGILLEGHGSKPRDLVADKTELKEVTCFYLSEKQRVYGIESCSDITCDVVFDAADCGPGKSSQIFDDTTKILAHATC